MASKRLAHTRKQSVLERTERTKRKLVQETNGIRLEIRRIEAEIRETHAKLFPEEKKIVAKPGFFDAQPTVPLMDFAELATRLKWARDQLRNAKARKR